MKPWICWAAMLGLSACSVVQTQEMVNAEGRRFACSSPAETGVAAAAAAFLDAVRNRDLCIETNRRRGWLPVEEVGVIPVRFEAREGKVFVAEVLPGFPTLSTLNPADMLIAIDGMPVVSWEDARERLFGARGTGVELTLQSAEGELDVELMRQ